MTIKEFFFGTNAVTRSPTEHKVKVDYKDTHFLVWNKNGGKPRHYHYSQTFTWDEDKEVITSWVEPESIFTGTNTTKIRGLDGVSVAVDTDITFSHDFTAEMVQCETYDAACLIKTTRTETRSAAASQWFHDVELPEAIRKFAEEVKYTYGDKVAMDMLIDRIEMFIGSKAGSQIGSSKITVVGRPHVFIHLCEDDARTRGIIEQRRYENSKRTAELENDLAIRKIALAMERKAAKDRSDLTETNGMIAITKAKQELQALIDAEADARAVKKNELLENSHSAKESALAQTRKHELLMKLIERLPEAIEIRKDADGKETKTATNLNIVDLVKQVTLLIDGRGGLTDEALKEKIAAAYNDGVQAGMKTERKRAEEAALKPTFPRQTSSYFGM